MVRPVAYAGCPPGDRHLGDGANNSGRPIAEVRDEAVAAGVTINGLPILWSSPASPSITATR